jgi:hypothetical protein
MAVFKKANGDTQVVLNVGDSQVQNANAVIINTGIASPISTYKITTLGATANLAAELRRGPNGAAGAVEKMLTVIASNATVLAYQVDSVGSTAQLSVVVERSGWTNGTTDLQSCIQAIVGDESGTSSNIGAYASGINVTSAAVTSPGLKLA